MEMVRFCPGPSVGGGGHRLEKLALVQETYEPDMTVSLVARRHGIAPNQLFLWRKLAAQGALTATRAEEEVVPASEYRSLVNQVRELQRLLGKKTLETEILKEALEQSQGQKKHLLHSLSFPGLTWPERGSK